MKMTSTKEFESLDACFDMARSHVVNKQQSVVILCKDQTEKKQMIAICLGHGICDTFTADNSISVFMKADK